MIVKLHPSRSGACASLIAKHGPTHVICGVRVQLYVAPDGGAYAICERVTPQVQSFLARVGSPRQDNQDNCEVNKKEDEQQEGVNNDPANPRCGPDGPTGDGSGEAGEAASGLTHKDANTDEGGSSSSGGDRRRRDKGVPRISGAEKAQPDGEGSDADAAQSGCEPTRHDLGDSLPEARVADDAGDVVGADGEDDAHAAGKNDGEADGSGDDTIRCNNYVSEDDAPSVSGDTEGAQAEGSAALAEDGNAADADASGCGDADVDSNANANIGDNADDNEHDGGGFCFGTFSRTRTSNTSDATASARSVYVSRRDILEAQQALNTLALLFGDDDAGPRWHATRIAAKTAGYLRHWSVNDRREETGIPPLLVLSDVSGSMSEVAPTMTAAAIAAQHAVQADCVVSTHTNGWTYEVVSRGQSVKIYDSSSRENSIYDVAEMVAPVVILAVGDGDAERHYRRIAAELPTCLIWLDPYASRDATSVRVVEHTPTLIHIIRVSRALLWDAVKLAIKKIQ